MVMLVRTYDFLASTCGVGRSGLGQAGGCKAVGGPRGTRSASAERLWGLLGRKNLRLDGTRPRGLDHVLGVTDGDFS